MSIFFLWFPLLDYMAKIILILRSPKQSQLHAMSIFFLVPTIRLYGKNNSYSTFTEAVTAARNVGRHVAWDLI